MSANFNKNNISALKNNPGLKLRRSSSFLLWQLVISMLGLPLSSSLASAQTTTCTVDSSGACIDLYQDTLTAMQAVGYQPSGASSASGATTSGVPIPAPWTLTSFQGGTITASPMVFSIPPGTGVPIDATLAKTFVYACPGGKASTGTVSISASVSDTTTISSNQTVVNSSSSFNSGTSKVTLGYTTSNSGAPGGTTPSTYSWGTTTSESTATSSSTSNAAGTASTYTYNVTYSVEPGYGQYIAITDTMTQYNQVTWTSQMSVTGTLSNILYSQKFVNTIAPASTTQNLNGSGIAANVWYPPTTWVGTNYDVLASPSGTYAFFPDSNAYLYGLQWGAANDAKVMFKQGSDSSKSGFALYLGTNSPDNNKYGNFWGGTGVGSPSSQPVQWHPTVSPAYLALLDNGNLIAYNSAGESVWSSGTNKGVVSPPQRIFSATVQELLPSGSPFIASGTYDSTAYGVNATIGTTEPALLTSILTADELSSYCGTPPPPTSQTSPAEIFAYDDGEQLLQASYNPALESGSLMKVQMGSDEQERRRLEAIRRNEFGDRRINPEERAVQPRNLPKDNEVGSLGQRRDLGALVNIKGPLILKPSQYYAADLPGFKVSKITVRSNSLTNYVGFVPGSSELTKEDLVKSRKVRLKVGKIKKTLVKSQQSI